MNIHLYLVLSLAFLVSVALLGKFVVTIENASLESMILRNASELLMQDSSPTIDLDLVDAAKARIALYEELIERDFLERGMVVNRDLLGNPMDICDSLFFSSLRYIALKKLGYDQKASMAWRAIEASQGQKGQWLRHPECLATTSRDMAVGLLAAFSQNPPNLKEHLINTLAYITTTGGYIAHGRFDIGYLTPQVANLFRIYARGNQITEAAFEEQLARGFSTLEFSALTASRGYQLHLIALMSWIELELKPDSRYRREITKSGTILRNLSSIFGGRFESYRLDWLTGQLYSQQPQNLFFKWLRLASAEALSPAIRQMLLTELLGMPQFPKKRLPRDCDRKADYLWQRVTVEYYMKSEHCRITFNGVDFLWLAALLLEDDLKP